MLLLIALPGYFFYGCWANEVARSCDHVLEGLESEAIQGIGQASRPRSRYCKENCI
jgi:hypothetical protein